MSLRCRFRFARQDRFCSTTSFGLSFRGLPTTFERIKDNFKSTPFESEGAIIVHAIPTINGRYLPEMKIPEWISEVLAAFDIKTDPHSEIEIAESLQRERSKRGDVEEEEWKAYLAEHSVFFLIEVPKPRDSFWGTHFGPMAIFPGGDGTPTVVNPDISALDAEAVAHWEQRAEEANDPVMRARYADAAWDLAKGICGARPNHRMARIASDAYLRAVDRRLFIIPIFAAHWLVRALDLAISVRDESRTKSAIDSILTFYNANLSPKLVGVWIVLYDVLYDHPDLITEEQRGSIISGLEVMLKRLLSRDESNEFDPFNAQAVGEKLIQHYRKSGETGQVERVLKSIGAAFLTMAEGAGAMLATAWLEPVAERYEQEGMKAEAEALRNKLEDLYARIPGEMKTYSFPVEFKKEDIDALLAYLVVDDSLAMTLRRVGAYFTPKVSEAQNLIENKKTIAPLASLLPVQIVNAAGRPQAHLGSVENDPEGHLYHQLNQLMGFSDPILYLAMERIREKFAPSPDDLISFLYECPIFDPTHKEILHEGLTAYLERDHLKAIHLLVPQIEVVLRNLLPLIGIPPVKSVPRHPDITDVKSMNNVLEEPRIREILPEDVWRYLTLFYIDRRGVNLRNDLAHGLIPPQGFNEYVSNRVLHSILVLTPITLNPRTAA